MKKIVLTFISGFILITNVNAATNPYKQNFKDQTNCTWYAWKMAYEKAGVALPAWGNANTWYESAKKAGYEVGTVPKANSIAIWTKCGGDCAKYGHVGYVESVSEDGQMLYIKDTSERGMYGCVDYDDPTLKECLANGVSEETDRICIENAPKKTCGFAMNAQGQGFYTGDITEFIYLDNAPKTPVNNTKPNIQPTTSETPKKEEVKKSNNAYLKEIKINEVEFAFAKDVTEYNLEVNDDKETIAITWKAEDSKAKVEGNNTYNLEYGDNQIKLTVTAEDGTKKVYNINIFHKEKEVIEEEIIEEKTPEKSYSLYIIMSISSLIAFLGLGLLLKRKRNK